MNGDFQIIYDKLEAMEEKQDKRHEENLKTFGALPCREHITKINIIWTLMIIMVSGMMGGFWYLIRQ